MPREYGRNRRISDLIQRQLAAELQRELERGKFGLVTISSVSVSPDLSQAKVFVTSMDGTLGGAALASELNAMAGHFRHLLSGTLYLRTMPRLLFKYDASIERGNRLSALIDSIGKSGQ